VQHFIILGMDLPGLKFTLALSLKLTEDDYTSPSPHIILLMCGFGFSFLVF